MLNFRLLIKDPKLDSDGQKVDLIYGSDAKRVFKMATATDHQALTKIYPRFLIIEHKSAD